MSGDECWQDVDDRCKRHSSSNRRSTSLVWEERIFFREPCRSVGLTGSWQRCDSYSSTRVFKEGSLEIGSQEGLFDCVVYESWCSIYSYERQNSERGIHAKSNIGGGRESPGGGCFMSSFVAGLSLSAPNESLVNLNLLRVC